jgi:hypothetical protein
VRARNLLLSRAAESSRATGSDLFFGFSIEAGILTKTESDPRSRPERRRFYKLPGSRSINGWPHCY